MAVPLVLVVLPLGLLFLLSGLIINAIQVRPNPQLDWWRNLFFSVLPLCISGDLMRPWREIWFLFLFFCILFAQIISSIVCSLFLGLLNYCS